MLNRVFKSELTLKSIFNMKNKLVDILKTNKPNERKILWVAVETEYVNVVNLARIVFFYVIQLLFDRSN